MQAARTTYYPEGRTVVGFHIQASRVLVGCWPGAGFARWSPRQASPVEATLEAGTAHLKGITMPSLRVIAPLGLAAALVGVVAVVAVAPLASSSGGDTRPAAYQGPVATASGGGGGTPVYPSIVNVRLVRAEAALARAATWIDQGHGSKAVPELTIARSNMTKAWSAAKYVIKTTPPPVATEGSVAHASGGGPAGPSFASPEDTAMAVFGLQTDVVTTSLGLVDSSSPTVRTALFSAIQAAINARVSAITYIHSIPAPPVAGAGGVHAEASGGLVAAGWSTTMPNLLPLLDDEIQAFKGTRKLNPTLSTPNQNFLIKSKARDAATKTKINRYWPPLPADD
jgi:hypothetical protein